MKETLNISGIRFVINSDGYDILRAYIDKVEATYSKEVGGKEIISDIKITEPVSSAPALYINASDVTSFTKTNPLSDKCSVYYYCELYTLLSDSVLSWTTIIKINNTIIPIVMKEAVANYRGSFSFRSKKMWIYEKYDFLCN